MGSAANECLWYYNKYVAHLQHMLHSNQPDSSAFLVKAGVQKLPLESPNV
jgi:hypothetical protein